MLNLFVKKEPDYKIVNYLNDEINKLDNYFKKSKTLSSKHQIRDKIIYVKLKQKALISNLEFLKNAQKILFTEEIEDAYLALEYLEKLDTKGFSGYEIKELLLYKALIYELVDDNKKAKESYLKAVRIDGTSNSLIEYQNFLKRVNELKKYSKNSNKKNCNLEKVIEIYEDPKATQKIENIAKYYLRSKKSLKLAQKYFRICLEKYRNLAQYNPKKYQMQYILNLIKSVEIYKMSTDALKEAEVLIFYNCRCKETESYLLNKINALRNKYDKISA